LEPDDSPLAFSPGGEEGEAPRSVAYWLGSEGALRQLGLEPGQAVEQEHLELALQGRGIGGGQVRRPGFVRQEVRDEAGRPRRTSEGALVLERRLGVASYDLTFSAPKSVSVVWSQAGEEMRREIERAMLESWNLATEHLIRSHDVVMQGRDGGERAYGPAAGFAAAASLHATARRAKGDPAPAPQLHVHGLLVGLERPDGKLAGINSSVIFGDPALEAGAYARALLAQRLAEMGFEIESGTGRDGLYFEIAGVPEGLIEAMSGRTREIEAEAERQGHDLERPLSNRERAALAMLTRMRKGGEATPAQISAWWRAQAEEFEFGPRAVAGLIGEPGYGVDPETAARSVAAAVEAAMRKRGPTVTRAAARALVMAAAPGRMTVERAEEMIEAMQARGSLLALAEGRVTVPSIRGEELEVMATLREVAARPSKPLKAEAIAAGELFANQKLGEHELDPEQQEAIAAIGEGAGWSILTGRAGTGKTPVLQAIAGAYRHEGWDVVAAALAWGTAQELADDIDTKPLSLRQLIERGQTGKLPIGDRTLILIEEAGKVGLAEWRELARLVDGTGARVLAIGHAGQIGAIELPGMFEEMTRHRDLVKVAELGEIRRHRHEWMKKLQVAIDEGKGELAVEILQANDAITLYPTKAQAQEGMVERWFAAQREHGGERATMIVQGSNLDIDEVNDLAQERRLREGEIGGPSVNASDHDARFFVGDQVVLRKAAYRFDRDAEGARERQVENGTRGIVREVDPATGRIWVEVKEPGADPRRVEIDLNRPPQEREPGGEKFADPSWRLNYARHPNPTQGLSIRSVNHLGGHGSQDRESSYVGLSRQTDELHDHVNCEGFHGETKKEWLEEYARTLTASRRRQASIHYAEAPDQKIQADLAAEHALPEVVARGDVARPLAGRSLAERFDPLAAHRPVLGEERVAWIERHADRYATVVGRMDDAVLRAERAAVGGAFVTLDREGARRTLALQRDRKAVEVEVDRSMRHAESLEEQAADLDGWSGREEREALRETADTDRRLAAEQLERRDALRGAEEELRREGGHLDDWMHEQRDAAGRYVALDRELFARNRRGLEEDIDAVLREPPAGIVAAVGPAPVAGDPARAEWEAVVRELEANRLIAAGELAAAEPSQRELRDLDRRIEDLREVRGLGPEVETPAVEVPAIE
ncbi:MAG: relaxase domain-containing protein, partial [Actinobacteria bacterium]|nr:relaxase domain-containing protein [Actinomycetota bacterium]